MFKQLSAALMVGVLSLVSNSVHAALTTGSWKTANDNKTVIDSTSGLEWLRLNNTTNKSINEILAQTGPGGAYAGWRLATETEVFGLVSQVYGNTLGWTQQETSYSLTNLYVPRGDYRQQAYNSWANLMGLSYFADGSNSYEGGYWSDRYSVGIYLNEEYTPGVTTGQYAQVLYAGGYSHLGGVQARDYVGFYEGYNLTYTKDSKNSSVGVYLVSDGGMTYSSLQNPSINGSNPLAPNQLPRYTTSATLGEITQTSASLNLSYNGSDYTGFTYKVNGGTLQQSTTGQITLTDLLAGSNYLVEYTAYNANGTSAQWGQQLITTQAADVPAAVMGGLASLILLMRLRRRV